LYKQRVFVDRRLAQESEIVFNAGTHTDAIRMPYKAFAAIAHPVIGEFGYLPTKTETPSDRDGQALWI
jgi:Ala-tRNA(Pro) deacylase